METLADRIAREGPLEQRDAVGWILRLAKALEPVHATEGAHGKISAEAIATEAARRSARGGLLDAQHVGDPATYHSPERGAGRVSPEGDTWAAAVTLYLALTGRLPFPGEDDREVRRKIFGAPPAPLEVFGIGDEVLQGILDRALHRTTSQRLTGMRELRQALEAWHPDPEALELPPLEVGPAVARDVTPGERPRPVPSERPRPVPSERPRAMLSERAPVPAARPPARSRDRITPVSTTNPASAFAVPTEDVDEDVTRVRAFPVSFREHEGVFSLVDEPTAPTRPGLAAPVTPPLPTASPLPVTPPLPALATPAEPIAEEVPELPGLFDDVTPVSTRPDAITMVPEVPVAVMAAAMKLADAPTPVATLADAPATGATPADEGRSEQSSADKPVVLHKSVPAPPPPAAPALAGTGEPGEVGRAGGKSSGAGGGRWLAVVAGLAIAGAATGVFVFRQRIFPSAAGPGGAGSVALAEPPATAGPAAANSMAPGGVNSAAPDASNSAAPDASNSAAPAASAEVAPGASSSAGPGGGAETGSASACLMPMFPPDSFVAPPPGLNAVCQVTDPRKGGELVRAEVILGGSGRTLSDGMREWAVLGWYEMAAFAILRSSCCPSAPPLELPEGFPTCEIIQPMKRLAELAPSASAGEADIQTAFEDYTKAARCIARGGAADSYGRKGGPQGGEDTAFKKTLARVRAAATKK